MEAAAFLLLALVWYAFFALVLARETMPPARRPAYSLGLVVLALGAPALTAGLYLTPMGNYSLPLTLAAAGAALAGHVLLVQRLPPLASTRKRGFGYALLTLLAALLYAALAYAAYHWAQRPGTAVILAAGLALTGAVIAFPGLGERLSLWTERIFLHRGYAARRVVEEVVRAAPAVLDLELLAAMIIERTIEVLAIRWGIYALWDPAGQELRLVTACGLPDMAGPARWGRDHALVQWLLSGQAASHAGALPPSQPDVRLPTLDTACLVPVRLRTEPVGVLLFGPHASGEPYGVVERDILGHLADETAAALINARLFNQVARARREWLETFDALSDGVLLHDRQGHILRANRALARLAGRPFERIIGQPWFEVIPAGPEPRGLCAAPTQGDLTPVAAAYDLSCEGQRTLHVTVSRPAESDGSCVHVVRDVTDERALQQQLAQAEKLAAIGELLSGVAHELNNPLTTIIGFSELLQEASVPEQVRADLERISRQAKRSSRVVQSLLTFARQSRIQLAEVDINNVLLQALEIAEPQLEAGAIQVDLHLETDLPQTLGDAGQLQQVFLNLFTNAQQAMGELTGERILRVESQSGAADLRVTVSDNGPGIPHELLRRIFDPFFTSKPVGEGTGLGLSICYGIVREHGGRIWAESEPGRGATFTVELPLRHGGAVLERGPAPSVAPGRRILIVEDEEPIVALLLRVLQEAGHRPIAAADGEEGLAALSAAIARNECPDLIVANLKMPRLDGAGLYERVRHEHPELARRFLFISGDIIRPESQTFLESTDLPCLRKPFGKQELKDAVEQALARQT